MKNYFKEKRRGILAGAAVLAAINLYFGVLCAHSVNFGDLLYLDGILLAAGLFYFALDYRKWKQISRILDDEIHKNREEASRLLGGRVTEVLCRMEKENAEDISALQEEREGLTDYITRWAHEVKLPLSALGLMNERNPDSELQEEMQGCLERMQQLLNTMMMSSKLKNMENDVRYERVYLEEAVNEALKNQSYFLIREHFQIEKKIEGAVVYSDRRWLVYMLDQLIGNAVKYRTKQPALNFEARCISADEVVLTVKDNGIGIAEGEIPYIFDRGYIGSNLRNGDYRSTGMGLYFVKETAGHLGIRLQVYSRPGEGTRFTLRFSNNTAFFNLNIDAEREAEE
ncbi:HAMP domain-containing histidine kinase [Muricomes sp. OA1]|uniref:histidine kinase n=1 Tax=Hungatella hathewayi TaxID=154046 RepID=A0A3E2WZE1_9FIRM|nr:MULTISPECIES: HAMP domain-containing sensor histidine kinase [Clostridia]MEE0200151.1 HAMP domain-containing sensor histidine kinase [Muricomes sp.]MCH1975015.1 HAMP domain-containing histidine kinase [Muricomes sp. OA1]MRM89839.1 sensor histidine kinase [Faecalicatena contorta]RGC34009.1 sensor histidine kinase [Hungatella hathewayi]GKH33846.1 sensor histidine kinase [Faecalicatena contorta]